VVVKLSYSECEDCPYVIKDINKRKRVLGNDYQPEYVWCDKVGGKHYVFGWCSDCDIKQYKKKPIEYKNISTKQSRREKYNNKLKKLYNCCHGYPSPVTKDTWIDYKAVELPYYKRLYKGNHHGSRYKFYKKYSNKVIRRSENVPNYGGYKKCYEYWFNVD
jgi:hypothetical protein